MQIRLFLSISNKIGLKNLIFSPEMLKLPCLKTKSPIANFYAYSFY
jgi:hypothetical protein